MSTLKLLGFLVAFAVGGIVVLQACLAGVQASSILQIVLILTPLVLALLLRMRGVWVGLLIGSSMFAYSIPVPPFHQVTVFLWTALAINGLALVESLTSQARSRTRFDLADLLMLMGGVIVLARVLYDRPGSARMGESGGLSWALPNALAFITYFVMRIILSRGWSVLPNFRVACVLAALSFTIRSGLALSHGLVHWLFGLFEPPLWLLSGVALARVMTRVRSQMLRTGFFFGISLAIVAIAGCSAFRSRLYFALGIIASVVLLYGRVRQALVAAVLLWGLLAGVVHIVGQQNVPQVMRRTISTVTLSDTTDPGEVRDWIKEYSASGEYGWTSGFRASLYRVAWSKIREQPSLGIGFRFSDQDLNAALAVTDGAGATAGLGLAGGFHNSIVSLAVACGIPAALLTLLGLGLGMVQIIRHRAAVVEPPERIAFAALLAYLVAETGQMVMNGSGHDLLIVCMLIPVLKQMSSGRVVGMLPEQTGDPDGAGPIETGHGLIPNEK